MRYLISVQIAVELSHLYFIFYFLVFFYLNQVDRTESQQTLFRGNSIASKAMTYSFKIYGSSYLHQLLGSLIRDMTKSLGKSYEVDDAR